MDRTSGPGIGFGPHVDRTGPDRTFKGSTRRNPKILCIVNNLVENIGGMLIISKLSPKMIVRSVAAAQLTDQS